eukprot:9497560-Pyramimonas_sp.AAC.1
MSLGCVAGHLRPRGHLPGTIKEYLSSRERMPSSRQVETRSSQGFSSKYNGNNDILHTCWLASLCSRVEPVPNKLILVDVLERGDALTIR